MKWQDQANTLLKGHTDREDEARLLELLADAPPAELDAYLQKVDARRFLKAFDDRRGGPKHRAAMLKLLFETRIDDLTLETREALIRAAQKGRTSDALEEVIEILLLKTHGSALSLLKNRLDITEKHRDLQQLIFSDIDDKARRARILEHFKKEAVHQERTLKLLSDIDDTIYANWKDKRYPKKTVYPGVRTFYKSISDTVAFVTARPRDRPGYIEENAHATLRALGFANPVVLSGSFFNVATNSLIAKKKFENFKSYRDLFPECDFVFCGDSGQGDAAFAVKMREESPHLVPAAFIHDVVPKGESVRKDFAAHRVFLHDTYIGIAHHAATLGIIESDDALNVCDAAFDELKAIRFVSTLQKNACLAHHKRDAKALSLFVGKK